MPISTMKRTPVADPLTTPEIFRVLGVGTAPATPAPKMSASQVAIFKALGVDPAPQLVATDRSSRALQEFCEDAKEKSREGRALARAGRYGESSEPDFFDQRRSREQSADHMRRVAEGGSR